MMLDSTKDRIMRNPEDRAKIREEIEAKASDLGIERLVPLKGQSEMRMLDDLKESGHKFQDDMGLAEEKRRKEQERKRIEAVRERLRKCTPEAYLRKKEAAEKRAYEARKIIL